MKYDINSYEIERDENDTILASSRKPNRCNKHYHKQIEMVLMNSRSGLLDINQKKTLLKKGDIIFINSYTLHGFDKDARYTSVVCIPLKYISLFQKLFPLNSVYTIYRKQNLSGEVQKAIDRLKGFSTKNVYLQDGAMFNLLGAVSPLTPSEHEINRKCDDDITIKLVSYIDNNFRKEITLDTLSEHCHLSKNYVSSLFNSLFECNLNEYLNKIRLRAFIAEQSASQNSDILNTAYSVGYKSPRTFYNAFKKQYNMAPKEYLSLLIK